MRRFFSWITRALKKREVLKHNEVVIRKSWVLRSNPTKQTLIKVNSLYLKPLTNEGLLKVLLSVCTLFIGMTMYSQCAINAPDTVYKCFGQAYNLGTGITVTGTSGSVMYSWDGGTPSASPNKNVTPSVNTQYTLSITDGSGCTDTHLLTLVVLPLPIVNGGADVTICAGQSTNLCATATSANGAISLYNWIGVGAAQCKLVSPAVQTSYTVYALDVAGCAATDNVTVFVNPLPTVQAGNDLSMCLSQGSIQLGGTPAGGTWSGTDVSASGLFTPLAQSTYTLTYSYTNSQNCTNTDQLNVTVNVPAPINGGIDRELCLNSSPIQLPAVGTWSGSVCVTSSGLFTPSAVGTHNLVVTNTSSGCPVTDNVIIEVLPLPVVNAGVDLLICEGQCAQLNAMISSANGGISSIAWTGGSVSNASIASPSACPIVTTTYSITATDAKSCEATDQVTVNVSPMPVVDAGPPVVVCTNSSPITLSGQSPTGGSWSGVGVTPSGVFTPSGVGNVVLTYSYTSGANCTVTSTRTIQVIDPSPLNAGSDVEICKNATPIQLMSGGTWSGSTWVTPSGLFTPGATGNFNLTFSQVIGQCTSTDQVLVKVLQLPVVNAGSDVSVCHGETVSLNGTAISMNGMITSYQWNSSEVSNAGISNPTLIANSTTTLVLTATDVKNCQASDDVLITVVPPPVVEAGNDTTFCNNIGPVTLTGFSPAGGVWSGAGVTPSGVFTPGTPGVVLLTYTYTNSANCTATDTRAITVVSPSSVNPGSDFEVCLNSTPTQLSNLGTWSGSSWVTTGGLFTPGTIGTFPLTFTSSLGGCSSVATINATVLSLPIVSAGADQSVCNGVSVQLSGSATSANGGITSYSWDSSLLSDPSIANPTFTATTTTTLQLTAIDSKNCVATDAVTVTVNSLPVVDAGGDMDVCLNGGAVMLSGHTPAGGVWSGTDVTAAGVFTPTTAGTIILTYTYTNSANCSNSDTRTIQVVNPSAVNVGGDLEVCLGSTPIQLTSGGTWSGSSWVTAGGLFTPGAVGTFTLNYQVTLAGCVSTATKTITVLNLPTANAGLDQAACVGTTVVLNGSGTSSNGSIVSYQWSESFVSDQSIVNPTFIASSDVVLHLMVTDNKSCSATDSVQINVEDYPLVQAGNDFSICQNQGTITISGASPAGGVWSGVGISTAGNYTITTAGLHTMTYTYTSAAGCSSSDALVITVIAPDPINAGSDISLCLNDSPVQLSSGGSWSGSSWVTSSGLFTPASVGDFPLIYSVPNGICTSTDTIIAHVHALPNVNAGLDGAICEGQSFSVAASVTGGDGNYTYSWNNASLLDNASILNPVVTSPVDVTLQLTVTDGNSCVAHDDVTITVVPMPIPDFSVAPEACVNTAVPFTNTSTQSTSYSWSFGNSLTSNNINPTNTYLLTGIYMITLTAYNSLGCSQTVSDQIEIIGVPHADFSLNTTSGCSPLAIQFTNLSTGHDVSYLWNLSPTTSTMITPDPVIYEASNAAANYVITLTASNQCGSDVEQEEVVVNPLPNANLSTTTNTDCSPVVTHFYNTSQGNPTSYLWEFGDGNTSNAAQPTPVVYETGALPTDYTVKLYAYNQCGQDMEQVTLTILPNTITPAVTPSVLSGCAPLFVEFTNTTIGATQHLYNFDDGSTSPLISPTHIFDNPGNYSVQYYANDGCSYDTLLMDIVVLPTPEIIITANQLTACPMEEIAFQSQVTGDVQQIQWTFDDGYSTLDNHPTHGFLNSGIYQIGATVTGTNGCESSNSMAVSIHPKPNALWTLPQDTVCSPYSICFENNSIGATSYHWEFENGESSNSSNPCMDFVNGNALPESHGITLSVGNSFGCFDTLVQVMIVNPQPISTFDLSSSQSCFINEDIHVNVNTVNTESYQWYVDQELVATSASPVFHFGHTGEHFVQLITMNNYGCTDEAVQTFVVHDAPQIDIMPNPINGCAPLRVGFENGTIGGVSYQWAFSNGQSSNSPEPTLTFENAGLYSVQVTATSEHGCESTQYYENLIEVFGLPNSKFSLATGDEMLYETMVPFINESTGATTYSWDFGDGYSSNDHSATHTYQTGGEYVVTLTATNEYGCSDTYDYLVRIDNTTYVFVPNTFTPDNDGLNDLFIPVFSSLDEIRTYSFEIVNRWGDIVFATDNPEEGWQGNVHNGEHYVHNDYFTWTIVLQFKNGQPSQRYQGKVVALR